MDEINFSAKYKNWISIRKMSIDEKTTPQEVVAHLAGIRESIDRKAFTFLGINTDRIDEYAKKLTKGRRKGYSSIATIYSQLKPGEIRGMLLSACSDEKLLPLAEAYLNRTIFRSINMDFDVNTETLRNIFPELKIPKPRGRFGRRK